MLKPYYHIHNENTPALMRLIFTCVHISWFLVFTCEKWYDQPWLQKSVRMSSDRKGYRFQTEKEKRNKIEFSHCMMELFV